MRARSASIAVMLFVSVRIVIVVFAFRAVDFTST
jgi:hypothetical protein